MGAGASVAHCEQTVVEYFPHGSLVWEYSPEATGGLVCRVPACREIARERSALKEEAIVLVMIHVTPRTQGPVRHVYLSEEILRGSRQETEVGWCPAEETVAASVWRAHT